MRLVFADTSALIALRDSGDVNHPAAVNWLEACLAEGNLKLVLTNYVLAEVHAFFCRTPKTALGYVEKIRTDPHFHIVRAEGKDEREGWDLLRLSMDKTYSFVDAASFAVMRRMNISEAFAFDSHFRQHGRFAVLPAQN